MRAAIALLLLLISVPAPCQQVTHGPILGRLSHQSVGIWVRTDRPGAFRVRYGADRRRLSYASAVEQTQLARDYTGWVHLQGLRPATRYFYRVATDDGHGLGGSFRTLPHAEAVQDDKLNPRGLCNFSFEFACGNNQNPGQGAGSETPAFRTMLAELKDRIHFSIQNGDWLRQNLQHPTYCVVQINNVFDNPKQLGQSRWVAFPRPQVIFQYYQGMTGKLLYAESIVANT